MFRSTLAALAVLALGLSPAAAEELKGTLKKVSKAGNTLTLTVDGKDRTLPVSKDASFVSVSMEKGKKGKPMEKVSPLDGGLGALKDGSHVTVLTEKTGTKETVTSVKVGGGEAQPAKKKAKKPKKTAELVRPISADNPTGDDLAAGKKAKKADKAKRTKAAKKADKKKANKAAKKAAKKKAKKAQKNKAKKAAKKGKKANKKK